MPSVVERPERLLTATHKVQTGCGKIYVTVSLASEEYKEVDAQLGKTGGCAACFIEVSCTTATVALNSGTPIETVIKQFMGVRCPSDSEYLPSCPVAVSRVMISEWGIKGIIND